MPAPTIASLRTAKIIGFIIPSSNTAAETLTISILHSLKADIIPIFTRIPVLTLSTSPTSTSQFSPTTLCAAAALLADAHCSAILWNGTSGMFIPDSSLSSDISLAENMSKAAGGIPCSTTTLATLASLESLGGIKDISIAVPYTPSLTTRVGQFFQKEGFRVHAAETMDKTPTSNLEIAKCSDEEIGEVVRRSVGKGEGGQTKAVLVTCTNWPAARLVGELEEELGIPVIDSVAVTLWQGLRMVGFHRQGGDDGGGDMRLWGKLLSSI